MVLSRTHSFIATILLISVWAPAVMSEMAEKCTSKLVTSPFTVTAGDTNLCTLSPAVPGSCADAGASATCAYEPGTETGLVAHWTLAGANLADSVADTCTLSLDSRTTFTSDHVSCPVKDGALGCGACTYSPNYRRSTGAYIGPLPSGASPRTLAFWMKMDSTSGDSVGIVSYGSTGTGKSFSAALRGGKKLTFEGWGPTISSSDPNMVPTPNVWHHIALTYDGSVAQFYKDGTAATDTLNVGALQTPVEGSFVIGGEVDNNEGMTGDLKDVRVYNRVLTTGEIGTLFAKTDTHAEGCTSTLVSDNTVTTGDTTLCALTPAVPGSCADAGATATCTYVAAGTYLGLFFVGGGGYGSDPVPLAQKRSVFQYNSNAGTWMSRASMRVAREEFALTYCGGKIYAIGGRTGATGNDQGSMEMYDPQLGVWSDGPAMWDGNSWNGLALDASSSMYLPNDVASPGDAFSGDNYATWTSATCVSGKVYHVGAHCCNSPKRAAVFDPDVDTEGKWALLAATNHERMLAVTEAIQGKVYTCGGWQDGRYSLEVYDPATNLWTFLTAPPGTGCGQEAASGVVNDLLYVFTQGKIMYSYDPVANAWSTALSSPSDPQPNFAGTAVGHLFYVYGFTSTDNTALYAYDIDADSWTSGLANFPLRRQHGRMVHVCPDSAPTCATGQYMDQTECSIGICKACFDFSGVASLDTGGSSTTCTACDDSTQTGCTANTATCAVGYHTYDSSTGECTVQTCAVINITNHDAYAVDGSCTDSTVLAIGSSCTLGCAVGYMQVGGDVTCSADGNAATGALTEDLVCTDATATCTGPVANVGPGTCDCADGYGGTPFWNSSAGSWDSATCTDKWATCTGHVANAAPGTCDCAAGYNGSPTWVEGTCTAPDATTACDVHTVETSCTSATDDAGATCLWSGLPESWSDASCTDASNTCTGVKLANGGTAAGSTGPGTCDCAVGYVGSPTWSSVQSWNGDTCTSCHECDSAKENMTTQGCTSAGSTTDATVCICKNGYAGAASSPSSTSSQCAAQTCAVGNLTDHDEYAADGSCTSSTVLTIGDSCTLVCVTGYSKTGTGDVTCVSNGGNTDSTGVLQEDLLCTANNCTCANGTAAVATDGSCEVDNAEDCTLCDTHYAMNGQVCGLASCDQGSSGTPPNCGTCDVAGFSGSSTWGSGAWSACDCATFHAGATCSIVSCDQGSTGDPPNCGTCDAVGFSGNSTWGSGAWSACDCATGYSGATCTACTSQTGCSVDGTACLASGDVSQLQCVTAMGGYSVDASTGLATKDEASEDDDEEVWENSTNQIAVVAGLGGVMLLGSVICLYQAKKKPPTTNMSEAKPAAGVLPQDSGL